MGHGAVLGLGSPLLSACADPLGDDSGTDPSGAPVAPPGDNSFPFEPGTPNQAIYADWDENTVDQQNLRRILQRWELTIDGLVDTPLTLSFAQLVGLPRTDTLVDFHCVEGWSVYDVPWNGLHLSELFDRAGVRPEATHLAFGTVGDVYGGSIPLSVALEPNSLLAYGVDGHTLTLARGFPLRMVIPRMYGYKGPKYIERLTLTDQPVENFWVQLGYPYDAPVDPSRLREGRY